MPTLANANFNALFCMFKGEWGTRKSTQALSFPGPQYWVSWDQKMESIVLPAKKWGIDLSTIQYDDYNDYNKVEAKIKSFQKECKFKTIVIDNISSGGDAINLQTLRLKSGTARGTGEEAGKRIAGIPVNTMEDFNAENSALQSMMAMLKDINVYHKVNIIVIAHVIPVSEKVGGTVHHSRVIVTGSKKAAYKIPAYCHEVYHFNMKGEFTDKRYSVLTTHSGDDFARTSLPLEKEIVFDDKPLYSTYLVPAMKQLSEMKVEPVKSF